MVNPETISSAALLEMFYQMRYKESLSTISKFRKPNLPPQWNALFTIFFKSFFKRITESDCASKLFMTIIYGPYTRMNIDYGAVLWAQVVQSTISLSRHTQISCASFWSLIVRRVIVKHNIPLMQDALTFIVSTLHTTGIIIVDPSKFAIIGSIPEVMFRDVLDSCKLLEGFRKLTPSGFRPLTPEVQAVLDTADNRTKEKRGQKKWLRRLVLLKVPLMLQNLSERHPHHLLRLLQSTENNRLVSERLPIP